MLFSRSGRTRGRWLWLAAGGVFGTLGACDNPCQALCVTLAEYGEECGEPWSEPQIEGCIQDQANPTSEDARTCRDFGSPDRVRQEWTCDDVLLYQ